VIGKLVKYCGEDNVLWGTDSIWYGSPQDQIQAFRTFQIAPSCATSTATRDHAGAAREDLRAERAEDLPGRSGSRAQHVKRDKVARQREEYRNERPDPAFVTYGPKTRREFLNLLGWGGGRRDLLRLFNN
jgi:uncharacterized protein